MQLISAEILARGRVRRTVEKGREGSDVPDVVFLHLLLESARHHVVDHALAQRVCPRRRASTSASGPYRGGLNPRRCAFNGIFMTSAERRANCSRSRTCRLAQRRRTVLFRPGPIAGSARY